MSTNTLSSGPPSVATLGWQRGSRSWLIGRWIKISLLSLRCLWEIHVLINTFSLFYFLPSVISCFFSFLSSHFPSFFHSFSLSSFSFFPPCFLAFSIFFSLYQGRKQCRLVILRQFPAHEDLGKKSQITQSSGLRKSAELAPTFLLILKFHIFPVLFFLPVFSFLEKASILSHI